MQDDDGPPISQVEELDLDPSPGRSSLARRELLLGLLLLLVTLGWAGRQWWQQQERERNYRLGQQAEQAYRWTEARAGYMAASGYRDADSRAASVTRLIGQLQDNFVSARWHAQEGDWAAALRAIQQVRAVDPHYGDAGALSAESTLHVYREAVQGAVVSRPDADPPGLYYRAGDRWVWLEGSDRWSSVRSALSAGAVVYDAPSETGASRATPAPYSSFYIEQEQEMGWLRTRRLVAVSPGGDKPAFTPLAFDATQYDFYIAGDKGVWGVRRSGGSGGQGSVRRAALRDALSFPSGRELDFQPFGGGALAPVSLPGTGWVVLNADMDRGRLLLAHVKAERGDGAAIDLYLSDADGQNRRLLYSHQGALGATQFSPDGRYALVSTFTPLGGAHTERHSLVLVSLRDGAPPVTLREKTVAAAAPGSPPLAQMRATFIPGSGPAQAARVMVAEWGAVRGTLSLLDPSSAGSPVATAEMPGGLAGMAWAIGEDEGNGVVLAWQPWLSGFSTGSDTLMVARWSPGRPATTASIALDKESQAVSVLSRAGNLVIAAYRAGTGQRSTEFSAYSVPLAATSGGQGRALKIYSAALLPGTDFSSSGFAWQFGPELLSYIENGALHARSYDGVIDVTLESGPARFLGFDWASPTLLLR